MIHRVFAVYDLKACAYLQPFFSPNSGSAIRAFGDACVKDDCPFKLHPEDYQLFELGVWDDNAGSIDKISPTKYLCSANDFVQGRVPEVPAGVLTNGGER